MNLRYGNTRYLAAIGAALIIITLPARADEPVGCAAFKWPLAHEAALLQASDVPVLASGSPAAPDGKALALMLVDFAAAGLPETPERAPKMTPSTAGYLRFAAPSAAGTMQVTIAQAAWIDIVQDGHAIKPSAFSGARDCPGVRKSIRVPLAATPFVMQISGTTATTMHLIVEKITP